MRLLFRKVKVSALSSLARNSRISSPRERAGALEWFEGFMPMKRAPP